MKLKNLLFLSICHVLIFPHGSTLECPTKWDPYGWTTMKYLNSCVTLVPLSKLDHCAQGTSNDELLHGQNFTMECADKYCEDKFPVGYFWSWLPDYEEEKKRISLISVDWKQVFHGAALICTAGTNNTTNNDPCVIKRSNRSINIQGSDAYTYGFCYGVRQFNSTYHRYVYYRRHCGGFRSSFFHSNVDAHYVCLTLERKFRFLYFTKANYCNALPHKFFTCGHEDAFECEKKRKVGCNYNKDLNLCVSYYYTKAAPDRESHQRCTFDYGSTCNCTCSDSYTQWTSWSSTCKPTSRMRIAPFAQPSEELSPVNCSFENITQCCVQTETNPSSEVEECTNYIYGTNISLVEYNCSQPGGKRVVDEKGHFKCQCLVGYEGIFCQNAPPNCLSEPCKNGGTCSSDGHYYFCECPPGFKGFQCEHSYRTCDNGQKCENGGVCGKSEEKYACTCASEYTGVHCEYEAEYCGIDTCLPNGVCQNITSLRTFRCHCQWPYGGRRCDYAMDYCKADSCSGHGVCHNLTEGKTKCVCHSGYIGEFCDFSLYASVLPVCICATVFVIVLIIPKRYWIRAGMLFEVYTCCSLRKCGAVRTSTVRRRRSTRPSHAKARVLRARRWKASEESSKKLAKHDYVLPVFLADSSAQVSSEESKARPNAKKQ